jgi:hypothetical protein
VTFKDLKKRVSLVEATTQESKILERLRNKPFWIWNVEEHKQEDYFIRDVFVRQFGTFLDMFSISFFNAS